MLKRIDAIISTEHHLEYYDFLCYTWIFDGENMSAASMPKGPTPIPENLPQLLHSPKTPWHISPALFERIKKQLVTEEASGKPFAAVQITN